MQTVQPWQSWVVVVVIVVEKVLEKMLLLLFWRDGWRSGMRQSGKAKDNFSSIISLVSLALGSASGDQHD